MCALWQELLGLERVGIHDDWFALGGHSLLAMRLAQRTAYAVPTILANPTVAAFVGAESDALESWVDYARGMAAYMRGDYAQSVCDLKAWSKDRDGVESALVEQACAAMSRLERLVTGDEGDALVRQAEALVAELTS